MNLYRMGSDMWTGSQIETGDIEALATRGFRSVICNRPDGEATGQTPAARIESAAGAHGMHFAYMPVFNAGISQHDVSELARALEQMPAPVLFYCRSGTRSTMLWALAMAMSGRLPAHDIVRAAADAGFDVTNLKPAIGSLAAQAAARPEGSSPDDPS